MNDRELPLWADGCLRAAGEPVVRAGDPGFLLGLAAFETLLWDDGVLYFVEDHLARLECSAGGLRLAAPPWDLRAALDEVTACLEREPVAVRVTLTPGAPGEGPSLFITTAHYEAPSSEGVGVLLVPRAKLVGDPLETLKTSSRLRNALARRSAQERGAWEALLGTDEGDFVEGCVSNLFAVVDGQLLTPPTSRGALGGIMRQKLLEGAHADQGLGVREARVGPAELERASEVLLSNSLARVVGVRWIADVRDDLPGARGTVARAAAGWVRAAEEHYRAGMGR
jgi:branched-chain amino acid aminotransferase